MWHDKVVGFFLLFFFFQLTNIFNVFEDMLSRGLFNMYLKLHQVKISHHGLLLT